LHSLPTRRSADLSVLSSIGKGIAPVVEPMGLREENWPATVGLFTGIFAKEAVVGTLNALYGQMADDGEADEPFSVMAGIGEALASVPANIADAAGSLADPLGLNIGDVEDQSLVAEEQGVSTGIFGEMAARFDGTAGAMAYLLVILLYAPCVAATSAIWRETGTKWTLFALSWTTGLAYGTGVVTYQSSRLASHPAEASAWIIGILAIFVAVLVGMRIASTPRGPDDAAARTA
ncbi:ferrous iron transporter B, partial [Rhodovulum sulfidophilum]|nr:ferrous iron transporter B [Rhodovulum sulfidophilum]